jgi:hypothetical protein
MRLEQSANVVIGCYDGDNGTLSGRTDGRVLKFQWWEDGPTAGIAFLVLSSDGNSLNGLWYKRRQVKGIWYGRRVDDERRPQCQIPVLDALVTSIYDASRLKAKGYGDFRPIADNKTEKGRALNRRGEMVLK